MRSVFAIVSGLLVFGSCIPYINDIVHGRVIPARSTRFMIVALLLLALLQQHDLGSRWAILLIVGELAQSILVLCVSLKWGIGGYTRTDLACYFLLGIDACLWLTTHNSLIGIHLTILADAIACAPTIVKTYRFPKSETPLFYWLASIAAVLAIVSEPQLTYRHLAFPIYLAAINAYQALQTYRRENGHIKIEPHTRSLDRLYESDSASF